MKKRLKINGLIIVIAVLLLILFPAIFFRTMKEGPFEEAIEIFGIAVILFGQILRASARGYKSEHSGEGRKLIQGGPYTLVRNPMYLGILLIGIGIVAILFKWWVALIFLAVFIIRYILLIFKEEKKLLMLFPEYKDYCKRVPRIIPSAALIMRNDISAYLPLKKTWLKKEMGSVLAVLLLTLFLEAWQNIKSEGLFVYYDKAIWTAVIIILFIIFIAYLIRHTTS